MISVHAETHPLRINELLASNRGSSLDDSGASSDWLELHNTGARHYLYQSENGDVHQLSFDGKWTHQTLSPKAE